MQDQLDKLKDKRGKMPWEPDFEDKEKLSKILSSDLLKDNKGNLAYGKYIRVGDVDHRWSVEAAFLQMLKKKYGDVRFSEAIEKYGQEKK